MDEKSAIPRAYKSRLPHLRPPNIFQKKSPGPLVFSPGVIII